MATCSIGRYGEQIDYYWGDWTEDGHGYLCINSVTLVAKDLQDYFATSATAYGYIQTTSGSNIHQCCPSQSIYLPSKVQPSGRISLRLNQSWYEIDFNRFDSSRRIKVNITLVVSGYYLNYSCTLQAPGIPSSYLEPWGRVEISNVTQTTAHRYAVCDYAEPYGTSGTWSFYYGIGSANIKTGGYPHEDLTNLQPDTTYVYKMYITNNLGYSHTVTGSFRTLAYTKPSASLGVASVTNTSITMNYWTWDATISQFNVFVNGNYHHTEYTSAASGSFTITGCSPKTTYNVSIQPYTPNGNLWGNQTGNVSATTYPNPVWVSNAFMSEILPFNAKVVATSSEPLDTAAYCFTLLDGNSGAPLTGEVAQTTNTYNFSGLTPETKYIARVRVQTRNSGVFSGYVDIPFTTEADQASIFIKVNNLWRRGKVWIKVQGSWMVAKHVYMKHEGTWRKNNNF